MHRVAYPDGVIEDCVMANETFFVVEVRGSAPASSCSLSPPSFSCALPTSPSWLAQGQPPLPGIRVNRKWVQQAQQDRRGEKKRNYQPSQPQRSLRNQNNSNGMAGQKRAGVWDGPNAAKKRAMVSNYY